MIVDDLLLFFGGKFSKEIDFIDCFFQLQNNSLESTTTTNSASGWDWTAGRNSIDILDELAAVRFNLTGVEVAPGPYSISPALYFTGELTKRENFQMENVIHFFFIGDNRTIRLLETSYAKVMTLLQSHHDITFVAAVRQEPYNVGTLFSLSEGFTRLVIFQPETQRQLC